MHSVLTNSLQARLLLLNQKDSRYVQMAIMLHKLLTIYLRDINMVENMCLESTSPASKYA